MSWLDGITGLFGGAGGTQAQATPSAGLLDPRAIRQQAMWQGLGALSAGLLAAGQQRPASQPSPLPQALLAFPQGYNQGIQSGIQSAALDTQALDQQRMNALRASDPRYANLPTAALVAQASRAQARPMSAAEITAARLTPGLPWQLDQNGSYSLPAHDPNVLRAGSAATTQGRVETEGYGVSGVAWIPPTAFRGGATPGAPAPVPGGMPLQAAPMSSGGVPGAPAGAPGVPRGQPPIRGNQTYTAADMLAIDPSLSPADAAAAADAANHAYPAPAGSPTQTAQAQPGPGRQLPLAPRAVQIPGMPGVTAIMPPNPADTAEATAAAESRVRFARDQIAPQIEGATRILQSAAEFRRIAADPNVRMGPGGGVANMAAEWLRFVGANGLADRVQSPAFASMQGQTATQIIAAAGGSLGRGITDADARTIERQVPNPLQSRETFERFITLLEGRAQNNLVANHAAYAGSMPNYSPQTDPVTILTARQLQAAGIDSTILFKDPTRGVPTPRRAPQQPAAATAPAPGPPPGTVAPGGPNGPVALPQPPAQAGMSPPGAARGASGTLTNPARPANPASRDMLPPGAYYINPGDGQVYQRAPRSGPRSR